MGNHSGINRILSAIYCLAALLEATFYFYGSPLYVLDFGNPLINYGVLALFAHALVFAGICTCLFIGKGGFALQRLFRVAALSFAALNLVPAIFYYNLRSGLRLAPVGIALHLAPLFFQGIWRITEGISAPMHRA